MDTAARGEGSSCGECREKTAIYQCPGCMVRTCSLECCRNHKTKTGCSGKRNRAEFVPVSRMTDNTMRSDYFFLEEVLQNIPRDSKRARTQTTAPDNTPKSKKSRKLLQQAKRRGITLQVMPTMMVRHKSNTSWYCSPRDELTWKVEVVLHPMKTVVTFQLLESEENILDHVIMHCNNEGVSISRESHCLFIMKLPCSAKQPRYLEVDPTTSLKTILQGNTVIEYPTIYCVPQDLKDQFSCGSVKIIEVGGEGTGDQG